ncbi:MAG: DUF3488 and transglutaminase-like domain-containing protein [Micrococcales bacterium]|nr:DUF3488 and transglutaminase-like domain-containing protein [Micrococcales bacterium]
MRSPPLPPLRRMLVTWALMFLMAAFGWTMTGVFQGSTWRMWFAGSAIGMVALLGTLRLVGVHPRAIPVIGMLGVVGIASASAGGGWGPGGVVPTGQTWSAWGDLMSQAMEFIAVEATPVTFSEPFRLITAVAAAALAVLFDWLVLGLRLPGLAGALALGACMIPAAFVVTGVLYAGVAACAACVLLVLWAATPKTGKRWVWRDGKARSDRRASMARFAGGLCVLALVGGSAWLVGERVDKHGFDHGPLVEVFPQSFYIASGLDPLMDLGRNLVRRTNKEALRVEVVGDPSYLKLMTLNDFTGESWKRRESQRAPVAVSRDGVIEYPPRDLPTEGAMRKSMVIDVTRFPSEFLPVPVSVQEIRGLTREWEVSSEDGAIEGGGQAQGEKYSVVEWVLPGIVGPGEESDSSWISFAPVDRGADLASGIVVGPDGEITLRASSSDKSGKVAIGGDPPELPEYLQPDLALPRNRPFILTQTALEVAGQYQSIPALAGALLEEYLLSEPFAYSTRTPVVGEFDGDSLEAIAKFLDVKEGYCIHYAAAMAIMARELGIPSRIAMGFLPAKKLEADVSGRRTYVYLGRDLHAWPELFIDGFGWRSYEPTPGRGVSSSGFSGSGTLPGPDETVRPTPTTTRSSQPPRPSPSASGAPGGGTGNAGNGFLAGLAWAGLFIAGVAALASTPATIRLARRRRRLGRAGHDGWLAAAWREVGDSARDLGLEGGNLSTPRELAERLDQLFTPGAGTAKAALARLIRAVEDVSFAPPPPDTTLLPARAEIVTILTAMHDGATRRRRWQARMLPTSLFTRHMRKNTRVIG